MFPCNSSFLLPGAAVDIVRFENLFVKFFFSAETSDRNGMLTNFRSATAYFKFFSQRGLSKIFSKTMWQKAPGLISVLQRFYL